MLQNRHFGLFVSALETGANIATLLAACLLTLVLARTYFTTGPLSRPTRTLDTSAAFVGKSLRSQLPEVDWNRNGRTVLLALSTHCHFCAESAPFYRQLSGKSGKAFKIIAVLPQPLSESREYLTHEGVRVDLIRELSLDQVGVMGTPTMLLLNNRGVITKAWFGELNPNQQSQALKAILAG